MSHCCQGQELVRAYVPPGRWYNYYGVSGQLSAQVSTILNTRNPMTSICDSRGIMYNVQLMYESIFQGLEVEAPGSWHDLPTPMDSINLHIRGGHIIPWQEPANTTVFRY